MQLSPQHSGWSHKILISYVIIAIFIVWYIINVTCVSKNIPKSNLRDLICRVIKFTKLTFCLKLKSRLVTCGKSQSTCEKFFHTCLGFKAYLHTSLYSGVIYASNPPAGYVIWSIPDCTKNATCFVVVLSNNAFWGRQSYCMWRSVAVCAANSTLIHMCDFLEEQGIEIKGSCWQRWNL